MPRAGDRFVATVLFADIVGSTEMAAEMGDRRWNAVLGSYYDTARREVRRYRGREIDTAGDGFFAAFDAPNDGVRAATAIVESMWARGVPVRAGLHAGECEVIGKKVGGIAVHIGARVAGLAGAGEVVVTSTVRDLAAGSARVLNRALATLTPVDEANGKPGRPIPLPGLAPTLVTFAFDALWVSDRSDGVVTEIPIDARGGTETIDVGAEPTEIAAGADALWVADAGDGTVTKIDPFGATAEDTIEVGGRPTRVTVAFGRVWTTNVPPHG